MGEHTPVDALIPSIVGEYAVVESIRPSAFDQLVPSAFSSNSLITPSTMAHNWQALDFVTDQYIVAECDAARSEVRALIEDSDDSVLYFDEHGADWIKNTRMSKYTSVAVRP
jgi:hypothetical protein